MTERQCKRIIREDIQPVILGNSPAAHRLALRLSLRYGLSPLLLARSRRPLDLLNPFATVIRSLEHPRLFCEQLCDLSSRYEGQMLLLIPSAPRELSPLESFTETLESAYVLISPEELPRLLRPCLR